VVRFRASEIADAVGGKLIGPDVEVEGAHVDSRELVGGELFVPIVGERDGHDFVAHALDRGAAAYLTAREPRHGTAVVVDDPASALALLGATARGRLSDPVVGITGSVGKTTTKDLAAAVLRQRFRTHASAHSFNNELGVPISLLAAPDDAEITVIEMGSRGKRHIAELCEVARPTIGVVTAVDLVHTELFGDLETVAEAKGELVEALAADGIAILNADDPLVAAMGERTDADIVTFGVTGGAVRAERLRVGDDLRPRFDIRSPWGHVEVELGVRGAHNVTNALAAAAVGLVTGVGLDEVAGGLAEAVGSRWRMELLVAPSGAAVLNDAYNAGPASTDAALRALAHLEAERRIAVLGPMAELGEHAEPAHRRVAALADELGIRLIAIEVPDYGVDPVDDVEAALAALGPVGPGDVVLVKGSRVAGLERLVDRLLAPT
jgi:UDP-N-acetylmuramoyl-tripeptide--D-alanyl-D-alanine ligase